MNSVIDLVAVCGAGAMGVGIVQVAAQAGATVVVFDTNEAALFAGRARVEKSLGALETRGKISAAEHAAHR